MSTITTGACASHVQELASMSTSGRAGLLTITLAIGGMTCSACVNTITDNVSRLEGVSNVLVSLLEASAVVVVSSRALVEVVRDTIEDSGYDAQVIEVEASDQEGPNAHRSISLIVEGLVSTNCLSKVMEAVKTLGDDVQVTKPLISTSDPMITVSYYPTAPSLTIRKIISTISAAGSPPFRVSVHHPPTIEQLNQQTQILEQHRLFRRFAFSFVAAIPTFILGVVYGSLVKDGNQIKEYLLSPLGNHNVARVEWALLIIATPVMFYGCGSSVPYLHRFTRFGSMNLLVSLGVSIAYFSSIGVLVLSAASPSNMIGNATTYFDTVVFLTTFLLAGRYLQAYSRSRTSDAISALNNLRPVDALLLSPVKVEEMPFPEPKMNTDPEKGPSNIDLGAPSGSKFERISVDHLEIGDIVCVPNGSSPPADSIVMPGQKGVFDESSLTGESRPVQKLPGDEVFVGTVNKGQVIHLKVVAVGKKTMLDQIVQVVREGQGHRAPIERIPDLITGYFVPVITLLAILTWVIWLALGLSNSLPSNYLDLQLGGWPLWSLQFAIAVFVVACPCGIGLAAPTALLVGSGVAANCGILARGGGEAFQEMAQLDLIVFDKTGTLTEGGAPQVSDYEILPCPNTWTTDLILGVAAELEFISTHPLAIAIRAFCKDITRQDGTRFEEIPGRGIKAHFAELRFNAIIGCENFLQEHRTTLTAALSRKVERWKSDGKSVVLLAIQREDEDFCVAAAFAITDPIRPEAKAVVAHLQHQKIETWLLSGDNYTTAVAVGSTVGIPATNVIAGVLPHEKSQHIQNLQKSSSKKKGSCHRAIVAMVGDGINDAPALAAADVGIAIGSGSDVALSSASFILLSPDLRSLLTLHQLSRRIINRIKFNFAWAIVYNMITVPIAAGVLYPVHRTRLSPVWASLTMALSSITVVCSSLLLKVYKDEFRRKSSIVIG